VPKREQTSSVPFPGINQKLNQTEGRFTSSRALPSARFKTLRAKRGQAMMDLLVSVTAFAMVMGPPLVATLYSARAPFKEPEDD
jgi:hypothetical protein